MEAMFVVGSCVSLFFNGVGAAFTWRMWKRLRALEQLVQRQAGIIEGARVVVGAAA